MKHSAPIAAVALASFLTACVSWKPIPLEPAKLPANGQVRATLHSGERVTIMSPIVAGDTLFPATRSGRADKNRGIPLAQILSLETERSDATGVVLGVIALGALGVVLIAKSIKVDVGCIAVPCPNR